MTDSAKIQAWLRERRIMDDVGIPRPDQLWIIGNGVCPQQVAFALAAVGL